MHIFRHGPQDEEKNSQFVYRDEPRTTFITHYSSIDGRVNTHLPEKYWPAHELCFMVHDIMTNLLVSGRRARAFYVEFELRDVADIAAFKADVFDWLENRRWIEERAALLVTTVFPAVLGDMLHCFYEALETSRKGKLTISFMLLRKPLQESLFVLETAIADRAGFANNLWYEPIRLWSQGAGGQQAHIRNIQRVLEVLGETERFDPNYLAQLRYDKNAHDGFDGVCNKAMHLFTSHKAIQTEPLNINFIFTDWSAMLTQWSYIYSRFPYLLVYIHRIVEHICAGIAPTSPAYLGDMERRISALVLLWWESLEPPYIDPHLERFAVRTRELLHRQCVAAGYRIPNGNDLVRMVKNGAYPGESGFSVTRRYRQFMHDAEQSGSIAPECRLGFICRLVSRLRLKR